MRETTTPGVPAPTNIREAMIWDCPACGRCDNVTTFPMVELIDPKQVECYAKSLGVSEDVIQRNGVRGQPSLYECECGYVCDVVAFIMSDGSEAPLTIPLSELE